MQEYHDKIDCSLVSDYEFQVVVKKQSLIPASYPGVCIENKKEPRSGFNRVIYPIIIFLWKEKNADKRPRAIVLKSINSL